MSTNYYARREGTNPDNEGLHIGKSSGGWEFLFRGFAGVVESTPDWRDFLTQPDVHIYTESGHIVPLDDFWLMATKRPKSVGGLHELTLQWKGKPYSSDQYRDEWGYPFMDCEFC